MRSMKNWILLAVNAEAASACALSMGVAVMTDDGSTMIVALLTCIACMLWLMLFLSVNKEILTHWILDGVEKAGHALKKLMTRRSTKRTRDLVIVTFPKSQS